jgi:hypothetical protein
MHLHLRVCQGCREFRAQMSFLRREIRRHPALRDDDN